MKYFIIFTLCLFISLSSFAQYIKDDSFQITIDSKAKMLLNPKSSEHEKLDGKNIISYTEFEYANKYLSASSFQIFLKRIATKTILEEKEPSGKVVQQVRMDVSFDADGIRMVDVSGKLVELKKPTEKEKLDKNYKAPAFVKQLESCFEKSLCDVSFDEKGQPIYQASKEDAAKIMIKNGIIENARLFHAYFDSEKDEWESSAKLSLGNGGFAVGKLKYKKLNDINSGFVNVQVTGTLEGELEQAPLSAKGIKCIINGTQKYDVAIKEWLEGSINIQMNAELKSSEDTIFMYNTMIIKFLKK